MIEVNGSLHLTKVLTNNTALEMLDLRTNTIGNKGEHHISTALTMNKTLTTLKLNANSIGDDGVRCLAHVLIKKRGKIFVST
ncbi:unnamed protein product [Rotaria socialis]|uniref:Uncharacterized protein n=1 Tax=Rotaria socialis TaxID=392032 RepID=A0A821PSJ6_9BILA|nr:unnamed protein product [Rotaria socialis]